MWGRRKPQPNRREPEGSARAVSVAVANTEPVGTVTNVRIAPITVITRPQSHTWKRTFKFVRGSLRPGVPGDTRAGP